MECFIEDGMEACENEINVRRRVLSHHGYNLIAFILIRSTSRTKDRQDLAEALLIQGEVREHDRYVQEGNVPRLPFDDANIMDSPMIDTLPLWRDEGDEFYWEDAPPMGP